MTTDPQPDRSLRAVLTVTVETRPDGGHYFDQADFTAHATEWVRAALKGQHAVDEVTIVDQAAELARAQAEAHQYRTALQGVARAAAPVPPTAPTDRAAILRLAANYVRGVSADRRFDNASVSTALCVVSDELRRMAVEAPAPNRAGGETQQGEARVVAFRSPGTRTLYCLTCARQETGWQPVTDADEQAVCDFCGGRVHAVAAQTTLGRVVARYLPGKEA